jgi:hypothetical protein
MTRCSKIPSQAVAIDLSDDEHALFVARKLANALGKTIIVFNADGKQTAVTPIKRKLDS